MYVPRPYLGFTSQPKLYSLGSSIATKYIYRFGVALNDFPRQQDPVTTTLDDAWA